MRHGTKDQRYHQQPKSKIRARPGETVTRQGADCERDGHHTPCHNHRIEELSVEGMVDPDCPVIFRGKADHRPSEDAQTRDDSDSAFDRVDS
jgi:hypothetical protein